MNNIRKIKLRTKRRVKRVNKHLDRHMLIVPAMVLLFMVISASGVVLLLRERSSKITDARVVILNVDKETKTLPTREDTVKDFLNNAQITINDGDVVEPTLDTLIQEDNFHINVYRATPVVVVDGATKKFGQSAAKTPRSMAEQLGTSLYPEDIVLQEPSNDFIREGLGNRLVVDRAMPIFIALYGTPIETRTQASTVEELLAEKNVKLTKDDKVSPSAETVLTTGMRVFVSRTGTEVVTVEEDIPMPEQITEDKNLSFGTTVVRQAGKSGKKSVTYQVELKDGIEISRKIIQEVVVSDPVTQIVVKGIAVAISGDKESWMAAAGIASSDYAYVNFIISRESGWCPTKWQGQIGYCPAYYNDIHSIDSGFGYGLCQSTPAKKMASAGSDWQINPVTQLKWCNGYAVGRYGSWQKAYDFWSVKKWW